MKKGLSLLFVMTLAMSVSVTPVMGKTGNGKSDVSASQQKETKENSKLKDFSDESTEKSSSSKISTQKTNKQEVKKVFKDELNEQKKELQKEKSSLNQQLEELKLQYETMMAAGDSEGAETVLESISTLNNKIQGVQAQIKETINERYMVVKTMYTDEELAEFSSASDLISQMYDDAEVLSAGSITVNNNLIKFDTPAYIKNGVTLVPLRAISEELGGEVSWNENTQTVTVTNGDTIIEITANSTTATVNGETVEISVPATENCGRSYVPLRFLAESLGFDTEWDGENEIIYINDGTETTEDGTETTEDGTETTEDGTETTEDGTETTDTESTEM